MKTIVLLVLAWMPFISESQTYNESIGAQPAGPEPAINITTYQSPVERNYELLNGQIFRRVGGQIHNMATEGGTVWGTVSESVDGIVIVNETLSDRRVALKNYLGDVAEGKSINTLAIQTGTYQWGEIPLELYDCGSQLSPQEESDYIASLKKTQEKFDQQQQKEQAAAKKAAIRAHFEAESNAIIHISPYATNGEVWAEASLGEHYLKGTGCPTNLALATYWLSKAAAQGDIDASNDLVKLQR